MDSIKYSKSQYRLYTSAFIVDLSLISHIYALSSEVLYLTSILIFAAIKYYNYSYSAGPENASNISDESKPLICRKHSILLYLLFSFAFPVSWFLVLTVLQKDVFTELSILMLRMLIFLL